MSRPARGVWIEIFRIGLCKVKQGCRAPRGACGLKSFVSSIPSEPAKSRPARGVWIEIVNVLKYAEKIGVAPREGRVD